MTKTLTLRDANQSFARCIREVEAGEEFVITRNGAPVARLSPISQRRVLTPQQLAARERLRAVARDGWNSAAARLTGTRCMSGERFTLDTNVLFYHVDSSAGPRHERAMEVVDRAIAANCWLTLQAVSEFYSAVTRKRVIAPEQAAAVANDWLEAFQTVAVSAGAIRAALATATPGRASYWDALLVATAAEAGCSTILSENLAEGGTLMGVRVLNPFTGGRLSTEIEELLAAG